MSEFANKYEQEAHALVQGLAGTKWEGASVQPGRVERRVVGSLESFTRHIPLRALFITAAVAFVYGSLRSMRRR